MWSMSPSFWHKSNIKIKYQLQKHLYHLFREFRQSGFVVVFRNVSYEHARSKEVWLRVEGDVSLIIVILLSAHSQKNPHWRFGVRIFFAVRTTVYIIIRMFCIRESQSECYWYRPSLLEMVDLNKVPFLNLGRNLPQLRYRLSATLAENYRNFRQLGLDLPQLEVETYRNLHHNLHRNL